MTKETVYTMPYETEKEIHKANRLRMRLYDKYNSVQVYPQGWGTIRIVVTDKIKLR